MTTPQTTPELLPCPFCGCALFFKQPKHGDDYHEHPKNECVLAGDFFIADPMTIYAASDSITAWNRRAAPQPPASAQPLAPPDTGNVGARELLKRVEAARSFPTNTDPASRHVEMMGEFLLRGEPYPMLSEEPEHCGESLLLTVAALWEARKTLAALPPPGRGMVPMDWRPIETAPDAGSVIVFSRSRIISIQRTEHVHDLIKDAALHGDLCQYTHWTHLPDDPEVGIKEGS